MQRLGIGMDTDFCHHYAPVDLFRVVCQCHARRCELAISFLCRASSWPHRRLQSGCPEGSRTLLAVCSTRCIMHTAHWRSIWEDLNLGRVKMPKMLCSFLLPIEWVCSAKDFIGIGFPPPTTGSWARTLAILLFIKTNETNKAKWLLGSAQISVQCCSIWFLIFNKLWRGSLPESLF